MKKICSFVLAVFAVVFSSIAVSSCSSDNEIGESSYETAIVGTWMEDTGNPKSQTWIFKDNGKGTYISHGDEDSFTYYFTEGKNFTMRIWGTTLHCVVLKLTKKELSFFIEEEEKGPDLKRK